MVPIKTPIGHTLGFDPVRFAVMTRVNLQMSFLTPPFAGALFFVRGAAAPESGITIADIIRGIIPFVILIMAGLTLCAVVPELIN